MRLSSALAGALSLATLALASSDVVDLTAKSFDKEVTNDSGLTLVEFFAPWCGHCKALAPHYEEAATALKEKNIKIAKVDCTVEAELCQEHGISGYPTLKVFNAGAVSDYTGPRKADGIISYMTKQALPAVTEITDAEHESFKTADKIVVVSYTTSGKAPEAFTKFASSARDSYLFGHTASKSVLSAESITADQIVLYKSFDEPFLSLPGDLYKGLTAEKLGLWVKENAVPTLGEISPENFGTYAQAGKPIAYVFVDPNESNEALLKSLEPLAKTHKSELSWVFIDGIKFVDHAKSLNVDVASWPRFVVQDLTLQAKYPLKTSVTAANVKSFVEEYLAGDVAPDVKSAKVKEVQDESVWDLATDEYEQVVWEDGKDKDVFVEFFAPWCGHCKKLKPIWDTLGDKYADVPSVLIAKFDATENDVPPFEPFKIQGFPTLKFRPAGSDEWVDYSGDRSLESLVEFLEENAASDLTVKNVSKRATAETVVEKGTEAADTIVDKAGEAYDAAVEKGEEVVEAVKSTGEQVVRKVREEL